MALAAAITWAKNHIFPVVSYQIHILMGFPPLIFPPKSNIKNKWNVMTIPFQWTHCDLFRFDRQTQCLPMSSPANSDDFLQAHCSLASCITTLFGLCSVLSNSVPVELSLRFYFLRSLLFLVNVFLSLFLVSAWRSRDVCINYDKSLILVIFFNIYVCLI